jgi:transcriptional regulator with XRE-family HTH domain
MQNIPWYERIKQTRLSRYLSQREAAALLEIDERTYRDWELGKHLPNFAGRRALRDHFGVSPDLIPPSGRRSK